MHGYMTTKKHIIKLFIIIMLLANNYILTIIENRV